MLFDAFVLVGFCNMCVVFVMSQADLILAFGAIFGIWYLVFGIWYLLDFHHGLTLPLGSYSCLASSPDLVMSLDGDARSVPETKMQKQLSLSFFYFLGFCAKDIK